MLNKRIKENLTQRDRRILLFEQNISRALKLTEKKISFIFDAGNIRIIDKKFSKESNLNEIKAYKKMSVDQDTGIPKEAGPAKNSLFRQYIKNVQLLKDFFRKYNSEGLLFLSKETGLTIELIREIIEFDGTQENFIFGNTACKKISGVIDGLFVKKKSENTKYLRKFNKSSKEWEIMKRRNGKILELVSSLDNKEIRNNFLKEFDNNLSKLEKNYIYMPVTSYIKENLFIKLEITMEHIELISKYQLLRFLSGELIITDCKKLNIDYSKIVDIINLKVKKLRKVDIRNLERLIKLARKNIELRKKFTVSKFSFEDEKIIKKYTDYKEEKLSKQISNIQDMDLDEEYFDEFKDIVKEEF